MRRLLLDTHVLLWFISNTGGSLGPTAMALIADPRNDVYVSAASTWEISIKRALGKLQAPADMDTVVDDKGFSKLPVTLFHGDQAGALPPVHSDPFDRMLIAQAQAEGLELVTCDQRIVQYHIRCIAADR